MTLPGCPELCPGCSHRSLSTSESVARKKAFLTGALSRWEVADVGTAGEGERLGYRERTCLHAEWAGDAWHFGLLYRDRQEERSNPRLIPIPDCPVHSSRVRSVLEALAHGLSGTLPLVFVLISGNLVTLVLKYKRQEVRLPEALAAGLVRLGVEGVHVNFHPSAGNRVLSSEWAILLGSVRSRMSGGLLHGPASFQQLIPALYSQAIDAAEAFLSPGPDDAVIDLYSGLGATLKRWRAGGARTLGVELSGEAVDCARVNSDAEVLRGRCSDRLPQISSWLAEIRPSRTLVFANPPRLGLEPEVLSWLAESRPARIAYLSCSPGTLARDLDALASSGYWVGKLLPWDFFPQTHHVETLATLSRA